jgi:hypothetical protein
VPHESINPSKPLASIRRSRVIVVTFWLETASWHDCCVDLPIDAHACDLHLETCLLTTYRATNLGGYG